MSGILVVSTTNPFWTMSCSLLWFHSCVNQRQRNDPVYSNRCCDVTINWKLKNSWEARTIARSQLQSFARMTRGAIFIYAVWSFLILCDPFNRVIIMAGLEPWRTKTVTGMPVKTRKNLIVLGEDLIQCRFLLSLRDDFSQQRKSLHLSNRASRFPKPPISYWIGS